MHRITVIFLVAILFGCQTKDDEGNYTLIDQLESDSKVQLMGQNNNDPEPEYDITYELGHTHVDSNTNPLDIYSVEIYESRTDSVKLAKFVSGKDEYYFLSINYVGGILRFMSGAVVIDNDGFISKYRDRDPYSSMSYDGTVTESVTVVLNYFMVLDLKSAVNLRIQYEPELPISITPEGIENINRFVSDVEGK